ncbi:hypothetical protein NUW46_04870 [Marinobacter sp. MA]|uniref:hypothetical protein n=1 Tax=Marinobacter sp. MA TaxID=2971606 RepID=UPI003AAB7619
MSRKSLGTLTLDLIAKVSGFEQGMDKAERKSQKTAKQIQRYSKQIGASVAAGSAAAITGMAALVASTAEGARETKNLAQIAGATPREFQRGAYAVKRYGVETDKYADILKTTNERIGEFMRDGSGEMAGFFENIAPKVGVTADQFARLSGPEALQLYDDSLEAAGVGQKEMTSYMEDLASDSTALIPLLRDGGKEMRVLGDEAERTGYVLSDMDFEQLESVRRSMDELSGAATGMKNEVVMAALPAIEDLVDLLSDESTMESAQALGSAIVTSMNFVIEAIDGAVKVTQFLAEELAAFIHGPAFDDIPRLTEKLNDLGDAVEGQEERLKSLRQTPNLIPKEVIATEEERLRRLRAEYDAVSELIENARKNQSAQAGAGDGTGVDTIDTSGSGAGISSGGGSTGTGGSTDETGNGDTDYLQRVQALRQAFETEKQIALRLYGERNEEINELYQADVISKMEADHLKIQSEQEMQDQLKQIRQNAADEEARLQQQRQALILAGSEQLFGSLADITGQFAGEQTALYKTMFAVQKAAAIAQSIVAINTGIAQASAVPFPANLAAMASVAAATAGIVSNIQAVSIAGMAHDGIDSVPKEGTWLLDKGERVLTSPQADNLDAFLARQQAGGGSGTVVNVIEDNSRAGETETKRGSDGQEEVNVFVADIMGGGPRAKAMQTAFGLKRQGY